MNAPERVHFLVDAASGLRAVVVLDDLTLGPAAGGVRTRAYPSEEEAIRDAAALARGMSVKCALAGLAAGGGKAVVMDHPGLDRPRAFARLGRLVEDLGGAFRTAGDLGTTEADLLAMARSTRFVHTGEVHLAAAVARGLLRCLEACAGLRGRALSGLRVAVQGCGAIGAAVTRALVAAGAEVEIADLDGARIRPLVSELGVRPRAPDEILGADVDVVAPCAVGGVVDAAGAARLRAWAVCGAANGILAPGAAEVLRDRGVLHVPDAIASAGAVIEGVGRTVMGLPDRGPLIDALGDTAREVLGEAARSGRTPSQVADERARALLEAARVRRP